MAPSPPPVATYFSSGSVVFAFAQRGFFRVASGNGSAELDATFQPPPLLPVRFLILYIRAWRQEGGEPAALVVGAMASCLWTGELLGFSGKKCPEFAAIAGQNNLQAVWCRYDPRLILLLFFPLISSRKLAMIIFMGF